MSGPEASIQTWRASPAAHSLWFYRGCANGTGRPRWGRLFVLLLCHLGLVHAQAAVAAEI